MARVPLKYVVVRYVPDVAKDEPVNVGVIIQGPEGRMMGRFPGRIETLERLPKGTDRKFVGQMLDAIREELNDQFSRDVSAESLERWAASLSNQIRFTPPRATVPVDPQSELERLYERLVTEASPVAELAVEDKRVHTAVKKTLAQAFKSRHTNYRKYIRERVEVPGADWPSIRIGFAYRNGRTTLANPLSLDVTDRRAEEKIKVWETNYHDLLETNRYDTEHIVTVLHVPVHEPELKHLASRVLGKVSRVIPDEPDQLREFAWHVMNIAEEWSDEALL